MIQILLDDTLRSRLHDLREPAELCDASGSVVARVLPVVDPAMYEAIPPDISAAELERRRQSTEWYTTEQVLAHLERL